VIKSVCSLDDSVIIALFAESIRKFRKSDTLRVNEGFRRFIYLAS
jgi:hypothetical protein